MATVTGQREEEEQRKVVAPDEKSNSLLKSFIVFKCGHNFHKKCIVSKMDLDLEHRKKHFATDNMTGVELAALAQKQRSQIKKSKRHGLPLSSQKKKKHYECILCSKY